MKHLYNSFYDHDHERKFSKICAILFDNEFSMLENLKEAEQKNQYLPDLIRKNERKQQGYIKSIKYRF